MEQLINDFGLGLFFYMTVILLVIIFLLGKFAWKPIINALEAREEGIADALAAAEHAKRDLANLKADNEKLLAEARLERDAMLKDAREMKDKMIADAKEEAQLAGAQMIAQAQATIQSERNAALADIKNQVSTLSIDIAEKLLKGQLADKQAQEQLVGSLLNDIKLN